jgi:hypothetical protein
MPTSRVAHALSSRMFVQAAITLLTPLLTPPGLRSAGWTMAAVVIAAAAAGVGALVRVNGANARAIVIAFEVPAIAVGLLGMTKGHYIIGTIIGVVTLVMLLSSPQAAPVPVAAGQWTPPPPPGYAPPSAPAFGAPADNPYAPPPSESSYAALGSYAPPVMPAPVMPAPVMPASVAPAPVAPEAPPQPAQPEDVPPAPRSMTILPGQ